MIFVALGGNVGDVRQAFVEVMQVWRRGGVVILEKASSLYETEPLGGPLDQPTFLNAVCRITTHLSPKELLTTFQGIENQSGRVRAIPGGPRTLDLDLLLYDEQILEEPGLVVPHPRMHERRFVLEPLAEIAPDVVHSRLEKSIWELLSSSDVQRQLVRKMSGPDWITG